MKKVLKGVLICLAMTLVYMIINGVVYSVFPFSAWFQEGSGGQETNIALSVVYILWITGTIYYIVDNSRCKGIGLCLAAIGSVFFIQSFMTQIETMLFGNAFTGLGIHDILLMVLGELVAITVTALLIILLLKRKSQENVKEKINWKSFGKVLLINGLIYMVIYFLFGYFVAWKSEELRIFYSGMSEDVGFIQKMYENARDSFIVYPIQFVRGMLFTLGIVPLLNMKWKHKYDYYIAVCAVFLCTAVGLLIPNFMFPDAVRLRHLVEMTTSMLLFGVITAVLTKKCIVTPD